MVAIPSGFSPQEYLALEHANAIRHEYRWGLVTLYRQQARRPSQQGSSGRCWDRASEAGG